MLMQLRESQKSKKTERNGGKLVTLPSHRDISHLQKNASKGVKTSIVSFSPTVPMVIRKALVMKHGEVV